MQTDVDVAIKIASLQKQIDREKAKNKIIKHWLNKVNAYLERRELVHQYFTAQIPFLATRLREEERKNEAYIADVLPVFSESCQQAIDIGCDLKSKVKELTSILERYEGRVLTSSMAEEDDDRASVDWRPELIKAEEGSVPDTSIYPPSWTKAREPKPSVSAFFPSHSSTDPMFASTFDESLSDIDNHHQDKKMETLIKELTTIEEKNDSLIAEYRDKRAYINTISTASYDLFAQAQTLYLEIERISGIGVHLSDERRLIHNAFSQLIKQNGDYLREIADLEHKLHTLEHAMTISSAAAVLAVEEERFMPIEKSRAADGEGEGTYAHGTRYSFIGRRAAEAKEEDRAYAFGAGEMEVGSLSREEVAGTGEGDGYTRSASPSWLRHLLCGDTRRAEAAMDVDSKEEPAYFSPGS